MSHKPFACVALAVSAVLSAQNPADRKAAADFAKAEQAVEDSRFSAAHRLYSRLAKKYPHSAWGQIAALRSEPTAYLGHGTILATGAADNRVDVVVMGDGFDLDDQDEFGDIAKSVVDVFRRDKLLGEYLSYHNFVRLHLTSKDQGVTGFGREKETALGGFVTGNVQGQVSVDRKKARSMLDQLDEHDGYAIAIVKAGSAGTGGGGIAAIGGRADNTLVHEWGHAFGGLSDEYSTFTGHRGSPRNTVNVSTTDDETRVPWRHFVEAGIPGVGAYRGAAGTLDGAWKPTSGGCRMENGGRFCPVCQEQMVLQIYRRVDPIDAHEPPTVASPALALQDPEGLTFEVTVLEPDTHRLDVRWHVLPEQAAIRATDDGRLADRGQRGPLQPIDDNGDGGRYVRNGRHRFFVATRTLQPGRYQVVCRVQDDAKPSGQAHPWVLKDDRDLLRSERVWWIEVR